MNLQPQKAQLLKENGQMQEVDVSQLKVDNLVFVAKGAAVPIDGFLESTQATIDESALSGESVPVEKYLGDEMYAGTLNQGKPVVTDSFSLMKRIWHNNFLLLWNKKRRIHLLMRFCNISIAQYLKKSNTYQ